MDIVTVSDPRAPEKWHGTWLAPNFNYKKYARTLAEMIAGRNMLGNDPMPARLVQANDDQWAFVIGLVVCDLAKRIEL